MNAIQNSQWGQIVSSAWGDLTPHQWECFRLALMETETEQSVQGIAVEYSGVINEVITSLKAQGVKVVQSPVIMQTKTEMIVSIVVSERDYKTEMLKHLPLYERKSGTFIQILTAADREFRNIEQRLSVAKRNMFLDTAIESLPIFERDLAIETVNNLRYDQRREQIISRFISAFDQTTEETIKRVAGAYSNGVVEVAPTSVDGVYEIRFIGTRGVPNNMTGLKKALDIIIPAHLGLTYIFTFAPWEDLVNQTWGSVAGKTWNDLRVWEGVI